MIELKNWNVEKFGQLTPEAVMAQHQPAYKFRVSHRKSAPHTPFGGASVGFTMYVLSGSCTVALDWTLQPLPLRAGEFCRIPRGRYVMYFPEPIEYVKVLELPEEIWVPLQAQQCAARDA